MEIISEYLPTLAGDISVRAYPLGCYSGPGVLFWPHQNYFNNDRCVCGPALVAVIPSDWISAVQYSDVIIFGLVFVFLLLTDHRLFDIHLSSRGSDFFWRVGVMSILVVGMLVSTFLSFFPKEDALGVMSKTLYSYFASEGANMFWMIAPLIALSFINNRLKD